MIFNILTRSFEQKLQKTLLILSTKSVVTLKKKIYTAKLTGYVDSSLIRKGKLERQLSNLLEDVVKVGFTDFAQSELAENKASARLTSHFMPI